MPGRTKRVTQKYLDFSGGYQGFVSPLLLKVNETPFCYNVDCSRPGQLRKSLGFAQIGSGNGSGYNRGIFAWNKEDGTDLLLQVYGNSLYKYTGTASGFVSVGTGFGTGSDPVEFTTSFINTGTGVGTAAGTYIERAYISQGLSGGTIKYTTGASISAIADHYAKHLETYKGRLYAGNIKVGTKTYPSRFIFSEVTKDSFPDANYVDDMGEAITAVKEFSGSLFIFTENKVAAWDEYALTNLNVNGGTTNRETVQVTESRLIWYNRGGVYMYAGGTEATLISRPVIDWLELVTDATAVTGGLDSRGRYCLYLGDITFGGVSYSDVVLRYDVLLNAWDVVINRPFKYWTRNKAGGIYEVYTTNPDGQEVWQADLSYALNGSAQASVYQTPKLYGNPENVDDYKNGYEVQVVHKPTGENEYITVQYRLDGTGSWGTIEGSSSNVSLSGTDEIKVQTFKLPAKATGKFLELKMAHSSSGAGFEIYGVNLIYDVEERE